MGKDLVPQTQPEHPPTQYLGAEEVEAIKIARRALPEAMRNLVGLTRSKSESQRRQAIEKLFEYGLANRQQQFDMVTHQPVESGDAAANPGINLTLNKIELRLSEIVQNVPPEMAVEFAEIIERMERHAQEINLPIIDGDDIVVEAIELGPLCECGCGEHVNKYRSGPKKGQWAEFVHGHHLRRHMTHKRVPPMEIKRLKEAGQWPPKDEDGNILFGVDKSKLSKKERIKLRKAEKRAQEASGQ